MLKVYLGTFGSRCLAGDVCMTAVVFPKGVSNEILEIQADNSWSLKSAKVEEICTLSYTIFVRKGRIEELGIKNALRERVDGLIAQLCLQHKLYTPLIVYSANREHPVPRYYPFVRIKRCAETVLANTIALKYYSAYIRHYGTIYPQYNWEQNIAGPCNEHLFAVLMHGPCPLHRKSRLLLIAPYLYRQLELKDRNVSRFVRCLRDGNEPGWWNRYVDLPFKSLLTRKQKQKIEQLLCYYRGVRYQRYLPIPEDFQQWCMENAPEPFF